MKRSKKIFIGFTGPKIDQKESTFEMGDGYECWNPERLTPAKFILTLREKISPVNRNVLKNYSIGEKVGGMFGITEQVYAKCSWGLLIPDSLEDVLIGSYPETIFLLNLYSPTFLYPLFFVTDMGIHPIPQTKSLLHLEQFQNQPSIFKKESFVNFFRMMLPQSKYGVWQLDRAKKWRKEDWRLFVAALLFTGLKNYDNRKSPFGWQRESADMATILETLFTAGDVQSEEVGYGLRKRIAVLLSWRFPDIEKEIKGLYSERSRFVHGSFFAKIAKDSSQSHSNTPIPDLGLLNGQKEYVRLAFIAYLYLAKLVQEYPKEYNGHTSVMAVLEQAIIDIELRESITKDVQKIFSQLP